MRKIILVITSLMALAIAPGASADMFTGPWDSDHQPPTISNSRVTFISGTVSDESVFSCPTSQPSPHVITFQDPSGWASATWAWSALWPYCGDSNATLAQGG